MPPTYKRVPAVEKCFAILDLFAKAEKPLGISDISRQLGLNKSTVFNTIYTLVELDVLESGGNGKFGFGPRFYMLGHAAGQRSAVIHIAHPYLERINAETGLSAFLGIRSDLRSVLIDKVDSAHGVKISSEIGLQMPELAGAGIKAMLSRLSDEQVKELVSRAELKQYTPNSITDKNAYLSEIKKVREEGIAFDREEYIEGMVAVGIPIEANGRNMQAAIWAVGLAQQTTRESNPTLKEYLRGVAKEINARLQ
jgi:IclR family KDG regulon transcriptional repressor